VPVFNVAIIRALNKGSQPQPIEAAQTHGEDKDIMTCSQLEARVVNQPVAP
jgi:hypothetical protein